MPPLKEGEIPMNYLEVFGRMFDHQTKRPLRVDREGRLIPAPSVVGEWVTAHIFKGGTSTGAIDLGDSFMYMNVIIPTLDTATVKVQVAETAGDTPYDLGSVTTASGTHNYATTFKIGGYRFIKLVASAAQTTAAINCRMRGLGGV